MAVGPVIVREALRGILAARRRERVTLRVVAEICERDSGRVDRTRPDARVRLEQLVESGQLGKAPPPQLVEAPFGPRALVACLREHLADFEAIVRSIEFAG